MNISVEKNNGKITLIIGILSVAIPLVVALLLFVPQSGKLGSLDVSILPHINAFLNTATFCCLMAAFYAIKNGQVLIHKKLMMSAFVFSSIFLVSYVLYHFQAPSTPFGDLNHDKVLDEAEKIAAGTSRYVYLFILLTHIILAVVVVPLVLFAFFFALSDQKEKHKKMVRFTFPIWAYVAFTGVLVYLMISQYYA
ncbi:MAG: DUF420 domain-containing protein [Bacteroidetes bacterium]|nr:MAG: DUF420 domain-containing protein [Bacteroidota bacterium]